MVLTDYHTSRHCHMGQPCLRHLLQSRRLPWVSGTVTQPTRPNPPLTSRRQRTVLADAGQWTDDKVTSPNSVQD